MIEYVFKPTRLSDGKRVSRRLYSGRYSVSRGTRPVTVPLGTPDRLVAEKRLRDIVIEKQRESEGIISPRPVREAAAALLKDLLADYRSDLLSRGTSEKHVEGSLNRIRRIFRESGWQRLGEITAMGFVAWRATLTCSAKTKKEYQVSILAFLNWLHRMERLLSNPLARVGQVETRGKMVREVRSFTDVEITALLDIAGRRLPAYMLLLYTGLRKSEAKALVWGDVHLDEENPFLLARVGTTKDKDKRAMPLHPALVFILRELRPKQCNATQSVFKGVFPKRGSLHRDFIKAKIERVDALGRVVHFHSFRKTFQTLGVRYGINQRSAQELLGHSDPRLTANVYTDVPALGLHREIGKLPTFVLSAQKSSQDGAKSDLRTQFCELLEQLSSLAQRVVEPSFNTAKTAFKMVEVAGFEPACP